MWCGYMHTNNSIRTAYRFGQSMLRGRPIWNKDTTFGGRLMSKDVYRRLEWSGVEWRAVFVSTSFLDEREAEGERERSINS